MIISILLLILSSNRGALSDEGNQSTVKLSNPQVSVKLSNPQVSVKLSNPQVQGDNRVRRYDQQAAGREEHGESVAGREETEKLLRNGQFKFGNGQFQFGNKSQPGNESELRNDSQQGGMLKSFSNLEGWKKYAVVGLLVVLLLTSCLGIAMAASAIACRGNSSAYCKPIHQVTGSQVNETGAAYFNGTEAAYGASYANETGAAYVNGTEAAYGASNASYANGTSASNASYANGTSASNASYANGTGDGVGIIQNIPESMQPTNGTTGYGTMRARSFIKRALVPQNVLLPGNGHSNATLSVGNETAIAESAFNETVASTPVSTSAGFTHSTSDSLTHSTTSTSTSTQSSTSTTIQSTSDSSIQSTSTSQSTNSTLAHSDSSLAHSDSSLAHSDSSPAQSMDASPLCKESNLMHAKLTFNMKENGNVIQKKDMPSGDTSTPEIISQFINRKSMITKFEKNAAFTVIYLDKLSEKTVKIYRVIVNDRHYHFVMRNSLFLSEQRRLFRPVKLHRMEASGHVAYCTEPEITARSVCVIPDPSVSKEYDIGELNYNLISQEMHVDIQRCKVPFQEVYFKGY